MRKTLLLFIFLTIFVIVGFIMFNNMFLKNQHSTNLDNTAIYTELLPEVKPEYEELYRNLSLGMKALELRGIFFYEGFEWYPSKGESKEFELFRSYTDEDRIKVYFDKIAQLKFGQDWTFTGAKIIKIELYHDGKKVAEK